MLVVHVHFLDPEVGIKARGTTSEARNLSRSQPLGKSTLCPEVSTLLTTYWLREGYYIVILCY